MNKKIVIIGGIIIIAALIVLFVVPSFVPYPFTYMNTTLQGGRFSSISFNLTNQTYLFVMEGNFSGPVNIYLFNSTAFSAWSASVALSNYTNGYTEAQSLEGHGALEIFTGATYFLYPIENQSTDGKLAYVASNATYNATSNYTFVFQNQNGNVEGIAPVRSSIAYIPPITLANLNSNKGVDDYLYITGGVSLVSIIAVIVGIILIVYGFLKKPKQMQGVPGSPVPQPKPGTPDEIQQRDALYKNIGNDSANSTKRKRKARKNKDDSEQNG